MNALLEGIAALLAGKGVGVWRSSGIYSATETGIVIEAVPQEPANLITLSGYPVSDDIESDSIVGVQVLTRAAGADPRPVNDLAQAVFNALHGLENATFNGVAVSLCWRQSGAPLGQDGVRRWSTVQNFYLRTSQGAA